MLFGESRVRGSDGGMARALRNGGVASQWPTDVAHGALGAGGRGHDRAGRTDGAEVRGWGWSNRGGRGRLRASRTDTTTARCACGQGELADGRGWQAVQARAGNGRLMNPIRLDVLAPARRISKNPGLQHPLNRTEALGNLEIRRSFSSQIFLIKSHKKIIFN